MFSKILRSPTWVGQICRYGYFILSTGQFQTYRAWLGAGARNPFLKIYAKNDQATRSEITLLMRKRSKPKPI